MNNTKRLKLCCLSLYYIFLDTSSSSFSRLPFTLLHRLPFFLPHISYLTSSMDRVDIRYFVAIPSRLVEYLIDWCDFLKNFKLEVRVEAWGLANRAQANWFGDGRMLESISWLLFHILETYVFLHLVNTLMYPDYLELALFFFFFGN